MLIHETTGGLGDKIRVESILRFLRKSSFKVYEATLPSISFKYIKKKGIRNLMPYILPPRQLRPVFTSGNLAVKYLNVNLARNFLDRIISNSVFDIILAETSLVGWLTLKIGQKTRVPLVVDVHGLAGCEAQGRNSKLWYLEEVLEAEIFNSCDHLLVVSEAMQKYVTHYFNIPSRKISVVYNGADIRTLRARFNYPLKVIYAGFFEYYEKIDDYLNIAKKANSSDFRFYLAGRGPLEKQILERIKKENIPIKYLGSFPKSEMPKIMSKMQIGIAPSTKDRSRLVAFPIKILDYMATGLPVITPKFGEWGEMIETEDCGIALRDDSIRSYIIALETLRRKDAWINKSSKGLRVIKNKWTWDKVLKPLEDVILAKVGGKHHVKT